MQFYYKNLWVQHIVHFYDNVSRNPNDYVLIITVTRVVWDSTKLYLTLFSTEYDIQYNVSHLFVLYFNVQEY